MISSLRIQVCPIRKGLYLFHPKGSTGFDKRFILRGVVGTGLFTDGTEILSGICGMGICLICI